MRGWEEERARRRGSQNGICGMGPHGLELGAMGSGGLCLIPQHSSAESLASLALVPQPSACQAPSTEDVGWGLCQEQASSHDGRHFLYEIRVQGLWGLPGQSVSSAGLKELHVAGEAQCPPLIHAALGKGRPLLACCMASQLQKGASTAHPPSTANVFSAPHHQTWEPHGKCNTYSCMKRSFSAWSRRKSKGLVVRKIPAELHDWKRPGSPPLASSPREEGPQEVRRAGWNPSPHTGTAPSPSTHRLAAGWSP